MEFLQNLRLATVPWPLRVLFTVIALAALVLNCYVIYFGFRNKDFEVWIAAGGYLLGVILPVFLILLVLQFSHSGVRALQDRTAEILTKLIPRQLALTADCSLESPGGKLRRCPTAVQFTFIRGECWADYVLHVPMDGARKTVCEIRMRLEINVSRANVDIFVPHGAMPALELFPHTLGGASRAEYKINEQVTKRRADGRDFDCIVLVHEFGKEFLWDPAEKLWFAQDLMFMLRSFVQERSELFVQAAHT